MGFDGDWVDACRCIRCSGDTGEADTGTGCLKGSQSFAVQTFRPRQGLAMHQPRPLGVAADAGATWLELGANEEGYRGGKNNDQEEPHTDASFFIHY